jgi:hypothetical protein
LATQEQENVYGIFKDYAPSSLNALSSLEDDHFGLKRVHNITGKTVRYSLNVLINGQLGNPNKRLIEFRIGTQKYPLFTVSDFARFQELIDPSINPAEDYTCRSNVAGLLAERMAWTSTYAWLEKLSENGHIIRQEYEEEHLLANSDRYILKVKNSPNAILLRKSSRNPTEYNQIKELDGFFLYQQGKEQYVIVEETKIQGLNIGLDILVQNLFDPLKEIFPDSRLIYVVYSNQDSIYVGGLSAEKRRRHSNKINKEPERIYKELLKNGIGTIFFTHQENTLSFNEMTAHVLKHADLIREKAIDLRATYSSEQIKIWLGNTPIVILRKDREKYWKEAPISK